MAHAIRCSTSAEERGDPMAGTAPPQARVLLVHQPGPWGPRGLTESRCDPDVARRIDAAAARLGMRVQAIRRPGKHESSPPVGGYRVGIADVRPGARTIAWWRADDLAEIATALERGFEDRAPDETDVAPLFLVCAHGRHDACCALRGRPVAEALQRARPGRVWETTHLGGDRFAANVLVLPTGELYGRVPPALASDFADRVDAGQLVPALMRGRLGLSPVAQAALVGTHLRLGIVARDALVVTSVRKRDDARVDAIVTAPDGTYRVTVAVARGPAARLTCRGPEDARALEYRVVEIEPLGSAATTLAAATGGV